MIHVFFITIIALFFVTMLFTVIYYFMPNGSFHFLREGSANRGLEFSEAASLSVSNQTLLGLGDITPSSASGRALVMVQSVMTLVVLLFFTTNADNAFLLDTNYQN